MSRLSVKSMQRLENLKPVWSGPPNVLPCPCKKRLPVIGRQRNLYYTVFLICDYLRAILGALSKSLFSCSPPTYWYLSPCPAIATALCMSTSVTCRITLPCLSEQCKECVALNDLQSVKSVNNCNKVSLQYSKHEVCALSMTTLASLDYGVLFG